MTSEPDDEFAAIEAEVVALQRVLRGFCEALLNRGSVTRDAFIGALICEAQEMMARTDDRTDEEVDARVAEMAARIPDGVRMCREVYRRRRDEVRGTA